MGKKLSDIKDLRITECLADNCINDLGGNFWNNFIELNIDDVKSNGYSVYYNSNHPDKRSLPDPDACSERLYEFHGVLWKKQRNKAKFRELELPEVEICKKSIRYKLNGKNITLGSDSIMNIYWHRTSGNMPEIIKKISRTKSDYKDFIKEYLKKANTIGGFILFPRHANSINQNRAKKPFADRFDLALECIRRAFINESFSNNNQLFNTATEDKDFFKIFETFENYTKFFCLDNSWVKDGQVLNLMNNDPLYDYDFFQEPLPKDSDEWQTFYDNIMDRLKARNKQIEKLLR